MSENAKNQLLELLKNLGCNENCAEFHSEFVSSCHRSTVVVKFPDGRTVRGIGEGQRSSNADIAAAQAALEQVRHHHLDLLINWEEINVEAQAGDALIKLGIYLSKSFTSASEKSQRLQSLESDAHLAEVFDQWKAEGNSDVAIWGTHLGIKRKATLVEAILWRRFGANVIATDAIMQFERLLEAIT
jgi:hypothetical protein